MGEAKRVVLHVIPSKIANAFIKKHHYSGKVVNNSSLHFGAFLDGKLHGAMSFGPPLDKSKILPLVSGTGWNEMLELNRMAFDDVLPRNSESRCISLAMKAIKKRPTNQMGAIFRGWVQLRGWNHIPRLKFRFDRYKAERESDTVTQRAENPQNDFGEQPE